MNNCPKIDNVYFAKTLVVTRIHYTLDIDVEVSPDDFLVFDDIHILVERYVNDVDGPRVDVSFETDPPVELIELLNTTRENLLDLIKKKVTDE